MHTLAPCALERWYSNYGMRARYNLSGSAAPSLSTADVLRLGGPAAQDEYLGLDLNYAPQPGSERLRTAIAGRYRSVAAADVQVTTGAVEALFVLLHALLRPGDRVIVQFPMYPSIISLAEGLGCAVLRWPLLPDRSVDLDMLTAMLARNPVRAVIVNNPHSPTGAVLRPDDLAAIVAATECHGAVLIADEVYRGIAFGGASTEAAADLGAHVVSIGDLAKPYGLGGLRVGWIATHQEALRRRCAELRDYTSLCTSVPGEFLAAIALEHHDAVLAGHLATARHNRALFQQARADIGWLEGALPASGFAFFPRVAHEGSTWALCHDVYRQCDVLLLPGEVFETPGYLRLGFGLATTTFAAGLDRLVRYRRQPETARRIQNGRESEE